MAPSNAFSLLFLLCLSISTTTTNSIATAAAQTALTESLQKAQSTRALVDKLTKFSGLRPKEIAALNDCATMTSDSVDLIQQSIGEFVYINGPRGRLDLIEHIGNVQTWVSAAMTDMTTCTDGFEGSEMDGKIKSLIMAQVTDMSHVTSNALGLVNKLLPPPLLFT